MQRRNQQSAQPDAATSSNDATGPGSSDAPSAPAAKQHMQMMQGTALFISALLLAVVGAVMFLLPPQNPLNTLEAVEDANIDRFAVNLKPPYYSVTFTSQRSARGDDAGYAAIAQRMVELASMQPGFLGVESTRGADGFGVTVSYWQSLTDIAAWRRHVEHMHTRDGGRMRWYSHYELRVSRVERAYAWDQSEGPEPPLAAQIAWQQEDAS